MTTKQAADAVLAAMTAKDDTALKAVAARDNPDPWLVAEELCYREAFDSAEAFAVAAPRKAVEKLPAYVASRRGKQPDEKTRTALAQMNEALGKREWQRAVDVAEGVPAGLDSIERLRVAYGRGLALRFLRRLSESTTALMQVGEAASVLGWLDRASKAFGQAGGSAYYDSNWERATAAWESRIQAARALGDKLGIASTLTDIGIAQENLGNYDEALKRYAASMQMHRDLGNRGGIAGMLNNIALVKQGLGSYDEALKYYAESLDIYRALGDKVGIARATVNIGSLQYRRGNYDEALKYYAESLELGRALGNRAAIAQALGNIGVLQCDLGNYDEALQHYAEALELARALGDRAGIADTLGNIGSVHAKRGNYEEALKRYAEALEIDRARGNKARIAGMLANLGTVQKNLGNYDEALKYYAEALEINRTLGLKPTIADLGILLGNVQLGLGNYDKALRHLGESLETHRALGNTVGIANTLGSTGIVHFRIRNYDETLRCYAEALDIYRAVGDKPGVARMLHNIGVVQSDVEDYDEALKRYAEALEIERALGNKDGIATTLGSIGAVQQHLGNFDLALKHYTESLEIHRALGHKPRCAPMLINMGNVQASLGQGDKALASFEEALRLLDSSPSGAWQARASAGVASLHLQQGQHDQASNWALKGLAHIARLSEGLAEGEGAGARERFLELFGVAYLATVRADDPVRLGLVMEQSRAGSLRESLGSRSALETAVIPAELRKELVLARHGARRGLDTYREALRGTDFKKSRVARAAWEETQAEVSRVARRIEREAKHAAAITLSDPDDLTEIRSYLAPSDALIYYALTNEEGVALVVRKDKVRGIALPPSKDIETATDELLDGDRHIDPAKVSALRTLIAEPLKLGKDVTRILVSPMGRLGYVPFSLLFPDHEVAYVPSGTAYGLLLEEHSTRAEKILGLGDPDYQTTVDKMARRTRAGSARMLSPLPATRAEVKTIADVRLLDEKATEAGLLDAIKAQPRWRSVHFACHGLVDPERPMLSALALTADKENDGFLTALEIFRMKMPADLVVMSACETGKGKIYMTEGIVGLTRAFMFAGTPRVICSLWKVDDEATQTLMIKFYELWNPKDGKKGLGAATALKKAQAFVRDHPDHDWQHPYYWAAWVLWGLPD